jgi:hypothetical protein
MCVRARVLQVCACCRCGSVAGVRVPHKSHACSNVCMSHARSCPCARCECTIDARSAPSIDQQPAVQTSTTTRSRSCTTTSADLPTLTPQARVRDGWSGHNVFERHAAVHSLHAVCFTRPCIASRCARARQAGLPRCCERSTDAGTHDEKIAVGHTPWR